MTLSHFSFLKATAPPSAPGILPDSLHTNPTTLLVHFAKYDGQLTLVPARILPH